MRKGLLAERKSGRWADLPAAASGQNSGICVGYGRGKVLGKSTGVAAELKRRFVGVEA